MPLTRTTTRLLQQSLAPELKTATSSTSGTQTVISTPARVYQIHVHKQTGTNISFSIENAVSGIPFFAVTHVAGGETGGINWGPGFVDFDEGVKIFAIGASTWDYTIFYTDL